MTTQSKGPLAGFRWLTNGISVGFRHPKPLLAGAFFLVVACLLPSLVTLPMQFHAMNSGAPLSPTTFGLIMAASILLGLLLVPLYAGYLLMVNAAERGLPLRALDIFNPYRKGEALRLIGYGLAIIAVYVAMLAIAITVTGGGIVSWYMQALNAQASHQLPPALPDGFGITIALLMLLALFMLGFYAISLGQVALNRRDVFGAIRDGVIGTLKNLLPLLVFAMSLALAWIVIAIIILLVVLLLTLVGKLIGSWLMLVLVIPLYIALLLVMLSAMFGVMYHLWRDVCGDDTVSNVPPQLVA
jgi:hypothetical protein